MQDMFSNDDDLSAAISAAGLDTGEKAWRMPLGKEYDALLKSHIADMKNIGGRWAGSITAACFLERFVDNVPWAHLDIAGMVWSEKDRPTVPKGRYRFRCPPADTSYRKRSLMSWPKWPSII